MEMKYWTKITYWFVGFFRESQRLIQFVLTQTTLVLDSELRIFVECRAK